MILALSPETWSLCTNSCSTDEKEKLEKQFDKIMEGLAMPNGVQKMTRRLRQHSILAKVLADERCRPQKSAITVLDVPPHRASPPWTALKC